MKNNMFSILLFLSITSIIFSCSRTDKDTDKNTNTSKEEKSKIFLTDNKENTIQSSNQTQETYPGKKSDEIITIADVTNKYATILYKHKMAEGMIKLQNERRMEQQRKSQEWQKEKERLLEIYENYSNRWEYIPDAEDRLWVAICFIEDDDRVTTMLEELIHNNDPMISYEAASNLAIHSEHRNELEKAMRYYDECIKNITGEATFDNLNVLSEKHRRALGNIYHSKGVAMSMANKLEEQIDACEKSAIATPADVKPFLKADRFLILASAYSKAKQKEKRKEALNEAEKIILSIKNPAEKQKIQGYHFLEDLKGYKKEEGAIVEIVH
jgi:tetratricopeptide (TPR) repeat protein